MKIKPIAIYLPQFHPIPENDLWWGKGFTEWTNVTKAKPLFKDHYQPHLPSDMGFYDLRLESTRIEQAILAKQYGIHGFCLYHYWFNGKRLLNEPLDGILKSKTNDFPFMLCWANENWTRKWDGDAHEILIKQDYSFKDDLDHIRFLCKNVFNDKRYIRVDNKPFIVIYRPLLFPDIKRTIKIWRDEARALGIGELHIGYMKLSNFKKTTQELGFDCAIEFHPDFHAMPSTEKISLKESILNKLRISRVAKFDHNIVKYCDYVNKNIIERKIQDNVYPGITPMWDNSARRKNKAFLFKDSSPELYGKWLDHIVKQYKKNKEPNKFLFINAWNEWAEGNHLEPCQKWGRQYLEATNDVLKANEVI